MLSWGTSINNVSNIFRGCFISSKISGICEVWQKLPKKSKSHQRHRFGVEMEFDLQIVLMLLILGPLCYSLYKKSVIWRILELTRHFEKKLAQSDEAPRVFCSYIVMLINGRFQMKSRNFVRPPPKRDLNSTQEF